MANNQIMIYDSKGKGLILKTFPVESSIILRAAGLRECAPIYMMVGTCHSCAPSDVLWTKVTNSGKELELCPTNTSITISQPGVYAVGNPLDSTQLDLEGDVNITYEKTVKNNSFNAYNTSNDIDVIETVISDSEGVSKNYVLGINVTNGNIVWGPIQKDLLYVIPDEISLSGGSNFSVNNPSNYPYNIETYSVSGDSSITWQLSGDVSNFELDIGNPNQRSATLRMTSAGTNNTTYNIILTATSNGTTLTKNITVDYTGIVQSVPLAMTSVSSVSYDSKVSNKTVTMTFSSPVKAAKSVDGTWIIDTSEGDVTITSITPSSIADSNSKFKDGSMMEPFSQTLNGPQGFDGLLPDVNSGKVPYDSSLNVDPGATGSSLVIPQNSTKCLVKSLRRNGVSSPQWSLIEEYLKFVFMPQSNTKEKMFAPGMSKPNQEIKTTDNLNLSVLKNLPYPSGQPTLSNIIDNDVPVWEPLGWGGENLRNMAVQYSFSNTGYSADLAVGRSAIMYILHSDALNSSEKLEAAKILVSHALDIDAAVERGFAGAFGAGQWHDYHAILFMGAFLLNDPAMLLRAKNLNSNMYNHPAWPSSEKIGAYVSHPAGDGQQGRYRRTFMPEDMDKPFWDDGDYNRGSSIIARYLTLSIPVGIIEHFPILLLGNGPSGENGLQAFLNGPNDSTNPRAAAIKLYDRIKGWKNKERGFTRSTPFAVNYESFFTAWRNQVPEWAWQGKPDNIDMWESGNQSVVTAGDGSISWDLTNLDFSGNSPITDREIRYSSDNGMTWIKTTGNNETGTISNLTKNVEHKVQIRLKNSNGYGPWSSNYPVAFTNTLNTNAHAEGPRNIVTTTGTSTASAPVVVYSPKIVYKEYPNWQGSDWAEAPSTLTSNQFALGGGLGYWSGYPAPTFTREWLLNGTVTAGSGTNNELPPAFNSGDTLQLRVTATNASGSSTETSQIVTIPSITADPNYIINTNFDATFAMRYPDLAGSFGNDGRATLNHRPYSNYGGKTGMALHIPSGSWSSTYMKKTIPAGTYTYEAEVITNIEGIVPDNTKFAIGNSPVNSGQDLDATYGSHIIDNSEVPTEYVETFSGQFTLTASTEVYFGLEIRSSTGAGSKKIAISSLKVKAV